MACEVFKIINKLSPEYINDLVKTNPSTYNFRAERYAEVPKVNTTRLEKGARYVCNNYFDRASCCLIGMTRGIGWQSLQEIREET